MTQSFEDWLGGLPKWLQTAASDLLSQQAFPQDDGIKRLADLCIDELNGVTTGFSVVPAGAFEAAHAGAEVRVAKIVAIEGVNAVDPGAALDFGDADLAVVYGHNGTGKSGFVRATKHAAGSRAHSDLLPNVFSDHAPKARASFLIERRASATEKWSSTTEDWTPTGGVLDALRHVHVFDSEVARHYMTEKAEASYEPRRLRFLTSLVTICDRVRDNLEARKRLLPSVIPAVPSELRLSVLATYLSGLKASLKPEAVKAKLTRTAGHADRVKALHEALRTPDPATRIAEINKRLETFDAARKTVEAIAEGIADNKAVALLTAKTSAVAARKAATEAANVAFVQASLNGVGHATWRAMWEAARAYSTQAAYQRCSFPHVENGARCPLCQQILDVAATKRLADFETFVKGEVEKQAKIAETAYQSAIKALPAMPVEADWLAHFASIPDAEQPARSAHAAATARRAALPEAASIDEVPAADLAPLLVLITQQVTMLVEERRVLALLQEGSARPKMESELRDLRMLDWCNDNLAAILNELDRLKKLATLNDAIKTTGTGPLTKKKGDLAEDELTHGYQTRFKDELKDLGAARISVEPVAAEKKTKGKIEFSLSIVGATTDVPPEKVLSEGEARVVALAAFLADVTVAGARTPFIFDDPISSLDLDFEEKVVARLLKLARTRQVLVFTHRISLLTLLREAVKKDRKEAKLVVGGSEVKMREIALRRLGSRVGLVTETAGAEVKFDKALSDLIEKRLTAAKELADAGKVDEYTAVMKGICSDIRILAERAIEEVLLNAVVLRFRRRVITQDNLIPLAKISVADCTLLDGIMTRFSCFEHSQPPELPAPIPEFDDVKKDATTLKEWAVNFRKRPVDPAAS